MELQEIKEGIKRHRLSDGQKNNYFFAVDIKKNKIWHN